MSEAAMRCENAVQLLPLQNEDELLATEEQVALEAHLSACASCQQLARGYLADRALLGEVATGLESGPAPAILDGFASSVMEGLRSGAGSVDTGHGEAVEDLLVADRWEMPVAESSPNLQAARPASSGWRMSSVAAAAAVVALVWLLDRPQHSADPAQTGQASDPVAIQGHELAEQVAPRRIRVIRFDDQAPRKFFLDGEAMKVRSVRQGGGDAPAGARPRPTRLEFGVERAGPSDTAWGL